MGKPLGISMGLADGGIAMRVNHPSRVEDAIWNTVEIAINEGWEPRRFKHEVAAAWEQRLKDDAKAAIKELES